MSTERKEHRSLPVVSADEADVGAQAQAQAGGGAEGGVSRRRFLQYLAVATGALAAACSSPAPQRDGGMDAGMDGGADAGAPDVAMPTDANVTGLPHLGGAPNNHQGQTVAAFVDTIVPGMWRDPTGAVGGIDVGAPALFFDPTLPTAPLIPLLVALIDGIARTNFSGRAFVALSLDERDHAVDLGLTQTPELDFGIQLVKLAFFSSQPAGQHLGYPGANTGYVHDPDFTFGRPMSTELTTDGNLP